MLLGSDRKSVGGICSGCNCCNNNDSNQMFLWCLYLDAQGLLAYRKILRGDFYFFVEKNIVKSVMHISWIQYFNPWPIVKKFTNCLSHGSLVLLCKTSYRVEQNLFYIRWKSSSLYNNKDINTQYVKQQQQGEMGSQQHVTIICQAKLNHVTYQKSRLFQCYYSG